MVYQTAYAHYNRKCALFLHIRPLACLIEKFLPAYTLLDYARQGIGAGHAGSAVI
jgi:hypothetical protein